MEEILLIGMGGHAKSIVDSIEHTGKYHIAGFLDKSDSELFYRSYKRIGGDYELETFFNMGIRHAFICIGFMGKNDIRDRIYNQLIQIGYQVPTIIDDSAILADDVVLEDGIFIGKHALINAAAKIEKMAIINSGSIVEHECFIGQYSHIAVGAVVCGNVKIGKHVLIGANSTIIQNIQIEDNTIVGAGSTVIRNVPQGSTIYGLH